MRSPAQMGPRGWVRYWTVVAVVLPVIAVVMFVIGQWWLGVAAIAVTLNSIWLIRYWRAKDAS